MQEKNSTFSDDEELLFRQVHPSFVQAGRVTSQAFRPTPKDSKKLSVNRESKTTSKECYKLHTEGKNLQSIGVWGVSAKEVKEMINLSLIEDPIETPVFDPSHALIDFSKLNSEVKAVSSKLADKARSRGCLYSPDGAGKY